MPRLFGAKHGRESERGEDRRADPAEHCGDARLAKPGHSSSREKNDDHKPAESDDGVSSLARAYELAAGLSMDWPGR